MAALFRHVGRVRVPEADQRVDPVDLGLIERLMRLFES